MDVSFAVTERHSTRAYLDKSVSNDTLRKIFDKARQSPSGSNLQPWQVYILTGDNLQVLLAKIQSSFQKHPLGEPDAYSIYPNDLSDSYKQRRRKCGEDLYTSLGISREDKTGRITQVMKNFEFFGAPVGVFFAIDKSLLKPQWAHLGMYIQTVMLLAQEAGLATCPQEAWASRHLTIAEHVGMLDNFMLYCGLAIGYEDVDHPINQFRTDREPLETHVKYFGFE